MKSILVLSDQDGDEELRSIRPFGRITVIFMGILVFVLLFVLLVQYLTLSSRQKVNYFSSNYIKIVNNDKDCVDLLPLFTIAKRQLVFAFTFVLMMGQVIL